MIADRASDELLLHVLHLRVSGKSSKEIARIYGKNPAWVRAATRRVIDADLAESGEPERVVRDAYRWAA